MIALVTVIILGALILIIGISGAFIGQSEIVISIDVGREREARAYASGCAEEALYRLKLNPSYVGGTVSIDGESCIATVSGSGSTRTVTATSTVDGHTITATVAATRKQNAANSAHGWSVDAWTEGDPP